MKHIVIAAGVLLAGILSAGAAEPVVGNWTTASGERATIAACGNAYCITLASGQFQGRQIGRMSGSGGTYEGEITDPAADRTYSGRASVRGSSMELTGCALRVFCRTQTWTKR